MTTAIEHVQGSHSLAVGRDLSDEEVKLIKQTIARDATDTELALFVAQANKKRLDPFSNQIWFTKRAGKMSILTGIDGYRLIADRTGRHAGTDTWWCGDDGEWREVWLAKTPPTAAKVTVHKITGSGNIIAPFTGIALWSEYGANADGFMFKKMPAAQLAKCAEALALRKAFPSETSGVYTQEEMAQADAPTDAPTEISPPKPPPAARRRPPQVRDDRAAQSNETALQEKAGMADGIPAPVAKVQLLEACHGDKEEASALWGDRGRNPITEAELAALLLAAGGITDAEIVDDEPPFEA